MADTKISALTAATTPLAGTEVLPIVQSGVTKQVSVANLTAGRTVSASTFTSTVATGTAPFTVTSTTEVANLTAASATTAFNLKSNATTGVMQIAGPGAGTTRVMTIPNANFTAARTDAAQTFTGTQTFATDMIVGSPSGGFSALVSLAATSANTQYSFLLLQNRATETATTGASIDFGGAVNWLGRVSTQFTGSTGGGDSSMSFYTGSLGVLTERVVIDSSGNTTIKAGNVVIGTSGKGIDFSATPGTGTSELFNDYETGTWTVTATCGTSGTVTLNSSYNTGKYTLVGNTVFFNAHIRVSSISSPVGTLTLSLPFTIASGTNQNRAAGSVWAYDITATAGDSLTLQLVEGTAGLRFATQNAADTYFIDTATAGMIKATTEISITGFFYVS